MAVIRDKITNFKIADSQKTPFLGDEVISQEEIKGALSNMVLSASGWRKVFAEDGDEESITENISIVDKVLVATIGEVFVSFLKERSAKESPTVLIALDSRYTGATIADIIIRAVIHEHINVRYLFISAAPEAMAYSRECDDIDGFIYISASHNPIGHNGVKFGLKSGGVISGSDATLLIKNYKELLFQDGHTELVIEKVNSVSVLELDLIYSAVSRYKEEATLVYSNFFKKVLSGDDDFSKINNFMNELCGYFRANPVGVLAEYNGSARTLSIDEPFMSDLGIKVATLNDKPRKIAHRIVPEGRSLLDCSVELERLHSIDSDYLLGYVPDNDGDRGNIVYIDTVDKKAKIIEAQDVFALAVVAELSYLVSVGIITYSVEGEIEQKVAVIVNGPTSERVDQIASYFGVEVFRAEVGEANVVNLAADKRSEGYIVRILGEGSNGGNITYPSAVRDPLNTVFSFLKILRMVDSEEKRGLFSIWCEKAGINFNKKLFTFSDIFDTLPKYVTTSAYEDRAIKKIKTDSPALLKKIMKLFLPNSGP